MEPVRTATIDDVAIAAGVSVATVSRALRNLPNVAPTTRARVQAAATALSYLPDPFAARLATGRTRTIGLAVPVSGQWYSAQITAGVAAVLGEAHYDLLLLNVGTDIERHGIAFNWATMQKRVDGLILVDLALSDDELLALQKASAPVVTVGTRTDEFPSITIDNHDAEYMATRHLVELGHTRIAIIGDEKPIGDALSFEVPAARKQGYLDALAAAHIVPDPAMSLLGGFSIEGGLEAMNQLLALPERPTAVVSMSDEMAFGAMKSIREHGLSVPEDISIVGFDDHDLADIMGLTTVRQPVGDLGALSARLILDRLDTTREPEHLQEPVNLIVRRSTRRISPTRS